MLIDHNGDKWYTSDEGLFKTKDYISRKFKEMYNVPPKSYASTENKNK